MSRWRTCDTHRPHKTLCAAGGKPLISGTARAHAAAQQPCYELRLPRSRFGGSGRSGAATSGRLTYQATKARSTAARLVPLARATWSNSSQSAGSMRTPACGVPLPGMPTGWVITVEASEARVVDHPPTSMRRCAELAVKPGGGDRPSVTAAPDGRALTRRRRRPALRWHDSSCRPASSRPRRGARRIGSPSSPSRRGSWRCPPCPAP